MKNLDTHKIHSIHRDFKSDEKRLLTEIYRIGKCMSNKKQQA